MKKVSKLLLISSLTFGGAICLTSCDKKVTNFEEFKEAIEKEALFTNKVVLQNDIDCGGADWTPIEFNGIIDGNGHKLSNLNILANGDYVGLVSKGNVAFNNITVENFTINAFSTGKYLGLLVGSNEGYYSAGFGSKSGGSFSNCHVSGTINAPAYDYVGGIAGNSAIGVNDSEVNVNITANTYIGGALGAIKGETKVENVTNNGAIKGNGDYVAGVVAYCEREYVDGVIEDYYKEVVKISNCTNNGTVTSNGNFIAGIASYYPKEIRNSTNSKDALITGNSYVGGIAGITNLAEDCTNLADITSNVSAKIDKEDKALIGGIAGIADVAVNCTNEGNILSKGAGSRVGGLFGTLRARPDKEYTGLINKGSVTGNGDMTGGVAGYLLGAPSSVSDSTATVSSCTNYAKVTTTGNYCGGLFGYNKTNDYWLGSGSVTVKAISTSTNEGVVESSGDYAGGVIGKAENVTLIKLCTNKGEISAKSFVGGIAGETGDIESCENYGKVHGYNDNSYILDTDKGSVGGIAGFCTNVNDSVNNGEVKYSGRYVGGVAGCLYIKGGAKCARNINKAKVYGYRSVGGVIGVICSKVNSSLSTAYVEFSDNSNQGPVNGTTFVGGVIGEANSKEFYLSFKSTIVNIISCSNSGAITGSNYVAGILAYGLYVETSSDIWNTNQNSGEISGSRSGDLYGYINRKGDQDGN